MHVLIKLFFNQLISASSSQEVAVIQNVSWGRLCAFALWRRSTSPRGTLKDGPLIRMKKQKNAEI